MNDLYEFISVNLETINTEDFYRSPDKPVFTTREWIEYIAEDANAEPIVVEIHRKGEIIGYFSGLQFKKFGVRIIGSPFNGWSTCYMGLDLFRTDCFDRLDIVEQLSVYLMSHYRCPYIEITDRLIDAQEAHDKGFTCLPMNTLELEINRTDDELFKVFKTDCRNFIRQFERRGARLEVAMPDDRFAEEYYEQLKDVFAKQGLVPTYSLEKVKRILSHMRNTGNVLCQRVISPEEKCIATSIFFGFKKKFFFWGGASYREDQHYRPNEYMIWRAIQYWRDKGCEVFDMVGVRDYKRKFGSVEKSYTKLVFTKYKVLLLFRNMAKRLYLWMCRVKGLFEHKK